MKFKSLQDAYIYQHLNKNNIINKTIQDILTTGVQITRENLDESLNTIEKHYKMQMKYDVMKAFDRGKIILIYCENKPLPTSMPFFLTEIKGEIVAIVCMNTYGTLNKSTKQINIDPKKLYCMMEGAYLALLTTTEPNGVSAKAINICSDIYAQMFTRILNKKYGLNMDRNKQNKVIYTVSRFFLENICGIQSNTMVNSMALKNCRGTNINMVAMKELEESISENPSILENLNSLINSLNLPDLTLRAFLEQWIYQYDASCMLALESFQYFLYNVIAVTHNGFINNQYTLEDIVGRDGSKVYVDLANYYRG